MDQRSGDGVSELPVAHVNKQDIIIYREYFNEVKKRYLQGDYTELTFRTPLENFLKKLNPQCEFIQEPDRVTKLGAPDFKVFRGGVKMGYVETKEPGRNLDKELAGPQIAKYKESINNIIFTDYCRFILIRNNQVIFDISLFTIPELSQSAYPNFLNRMENFAKMIDSFVTYNVSSIETGEELAGELSKKAKLLRDLAEQQLEADLKPGADASSLSDFYHSIQELINDISVHDCADAYSQTITYGLFLARMNSKDPMSRQNAAAMIPHSIGIIKKIFTSIASDLPANLTWIIDEIVEILNASNMPKVLSEINARGTERVQKDRDPFTFFYEDFLKVYDPEKRKHLGVYYTPRPVVNFIVKSTNSILKSEFGKKLGFADDSVTVLDPAVGTGTFLYFVYLKTLDELKQHHLSGLINTKITSHVLKDFYGFEVMMTPYIFSHLKLSSLLKKWFYSFKDDDRVQVFLTNTLEPSETHGPIPYLRELNEESRKANEIKQKKIIAIVSNPPYSGESFNRGPWIRNLMQGYTTKDGREDTGYYVVDGASIGERTTKWIGNDYVKFIRFAQWKIDSEGEGVVGFITDNSYLDNPTFRGVRQSLTKTFNQIHVLNLHGHFRKDRNPTSIGGKDENVFDIEQGVAIVILVKSSNQEESSVDYTDLWGTREHKFGWLDRMALDTIKWKELVPKSPQYYFVPVDAETDDLYLSSPSLPEIFPLNKVGIVTSRDDLTIKWSKQDIWQTVSDFVNLDRDEAKLKFNLKKESHTWKFDSAKEDLKVSGPSREKIVPILYRPFDIRFTYYTGKTSGFQYRPMSEVMNHMLRPNLSLLFNRREALPGQYADFLVTDVMAEHKASSRYDTCYQAPLYKYQDDKRTANVDSSLMAKLSGQYGKTLTPEDIFYYVYAVCYSPTYRARYDADLRRDYPRIPFATDSATFHKMAGFGERLVQLHLGKADLHPRTRFDIQGSNVVEKVEYAQGTIVINETQQFASIPQDVWGFTIGGYQVLDKWLKSRKGRTLSSHDIEELLKLVEVIRETLALMKQINDVPFLPKETKN